MSGYKPLAWMVGAVVALSVLIGLVFNMTNSNAYRDACKGYPIAMDTARGALQTATTDADRETWITKILVLADDAKDDGCAVDPASYLAGFVTPTDKEGGKKVASDKWKYHFYTLDKGKTGTNDFGPPVKGGKKAADGDKKAEAKIEAEFWERLEHDPALLSANGGQILTGKDGGVALTKKLMKSKKARDAYLAKVKAAVKSMEVEERGQQTVDSAYMKVGPDGVPRTYAALNVWRSGTYYVLKVKTVKGKVYNHRLECGFQWDTGRKVPPAIYVPPTTYPFVTAHPCLNGKDRDDNGKCTVPNQPPSGGCKKNCGNNAKDPSEDPAQNGNAGNGGGKNQDPGPGATTKPTHAPDQPRENPAQPTTGSGGSDGGSDNGGGSTKVDTEPDAPQPTDPATGTVKDS